MSEGAHFLKPRSPPKNNTEHLDGEDYNSNYIPKVTCNKHRPNPEKGKKHKTASY